jgi:hypothetical protein
MSGHTYLVETREYLAYCTVANAHCLTNCCICAYVIGLLQNVTKLNTEITGNMFEGSDQQVLYSQSAVNFHSSLFRLQIYEAHTISVLEIWKCSKVLHSAECS